ncbi:MAG: hypothetical protein KF819_05035 [Labilithrix sp.]|nr:hypothetical protein [Labilithrix sp.]
MTLTLARVPALRLIRTPRAWLSVFVWTVIAIASAVVVKSQGSTTGADHVMRGAFGVVVLPLVAYGIVGSALGGAGLRRGIRGVVALGAAPRPAALATILVALASAALVCSLLAGLVCVLAHGAQDPPLSRDLPTSIWIGALGGAAYAAYFSAGSAIGKGAMRGVFLAFDWIVGAGAGVGSVFVPRGHVTSLLGGSLAADLSQRTSSVFLAVICAAYVALALLLTRRA